MRAVRFHSYGGPDVLQIETVPLPMPEPTEVRIRIHGSSLNPADLGGRDGSMRLVHARHLPHIPGYDAAGVVDVCGDTVTGFLPGDPVFTMTGLSGGAHAEFVCVEQAQVAYAPTRISLVEAGTVPLAGLTALQGLRRVGHLHAGQRLLVNGAAGGVGSFAVQIGKAMGCHVTAVGHGETRDLMEGLGADEVVDYTQEDVTKRPQVWDVVFDAAGKLDLRALRAALTPESIVVSPAPTPQNVLLSGLHVAGVEAIPEYHFFITQPNGYDLALLARMIDNGDMNPQIDQVFAMDDIQAAHRYVEDSRRTRGKVGVQVAANGA